MATSIGGDGALVCGGFRFDLDADVLTPSARCDRITLAGDPIPFDDLPSPLGIAAIAALPDGRVLVAGGVPDAIDIPFENGFLIGENTGLATDQAWLYEPGAGWHAVGPMVQARAGARAVVSGDGRIVLIGGARNAGTLIAADSGPVFCPEIFDPEQEVFLSGGSCSTPGSGAFPIVSAQPGMGAFVVEGHFAEPTHELGGRAYGIIGLAPPL